jgi:hypothetical protein
MASSILRYDNSRHHQSDDIIIHLSLRSRPVSDIPRSQGGLTHKIQRHSSWIYGCPQHNAGSLANGVKWELNSALVYIRAVTVQYRKPSIGTQWGDQLALSIDPRWWWKQDAINIQVAIDNHARYKCPGCIRLVVRPLKSYTSDETSQWLWYTSNGPSLSADGITK